MQSCARQVVRSTGDTHKRGCRRRRPGWSYIGQVSACLLPQVWVREWRPSLEVCIGVRADTDMGPPAVACPPSICPLETVSPWQRVKAGVRKATCRVHPAVFTICPCCCCCRDAVCQQSPRSERKRKKKRLAK